MKVITDFDRTITLPHSTSWSVLESDLMPGSFAQQARELRRHYRAREEQGLNVDEWWSKHLELLVTYKLSKQTIQAAAKRIHFREGVAELFAEHQVTVISAGLGDVIVEALRRVTNKEVSIIANFVDWQDGLAIGYNKGPITSANKRNIETPFVDLVLGDSLHDWFPSERSFCFSDTPVTSYTQTFPALGRIPL